METDTKERILVEAVKLFAQKGFSATAMSDIAAKLGVTKAALYKHYAGKQEILNGIIKKMQCEDEKRAGKYNMPRGDMGKVIEGYKNTEFEKIKEYTKAQFLHWTAEEFPCCFRKMLTLEQYRDKTMQELYQNCLATGPLGYIANIFEGMTKNKNKENAKELALNFYAPIFLLYSVYDSGESKENVLSMLDKHVECFSKTLDAYIKGE